MGVSSGCSDAAIFKNKHVSRGSMDRAVLIRYFLFAGFIALAAWGGISLGADPDFVFDKFLSAGFFFMMYLLYERFHLNLKLVLPAVFAIGLHQAKLYGEVYFSFIQFDMVMHFVGAFAIALIFFRWLIHEERSFRHWKKVALLTILIVMGIGSLLEIVEFFGYANLPEGGGILHFGEGDEGGWSDTAQDLIFNFIGALVGVVLMSIGVVWKMRSFVS